MATQNPYAAPRANVADAADPTEDIETLRKLASGQKLLIYSILLSLVAGALQYALKSNGFGLVLNLIAAVMAIVGAVRTAGGLGQGTVAKIIYAIAMFIPLVSLIIMISLSVRASRRLKEAGYSVGLLGAKVD